MAICNEPAALHSLKLLPLCFLHPSAVCPSTLSIRVTLMTLMETVVFASLPHFRPPLFHLYTSADPSSSLHSKLPVWSQSVSLKHLGEITTNLRPNVEGHGVFYRTEEEEGAAAELFHLRYVSIWGKKEKENKEKVSLSIQRTSTDVPLRIPLKSGHKLRRLAYFLSFC